LTAGDSWPILFNIIFQPFGNPERLLRKNMKILKAISPAGIKYMYCMITLFRPYCFKIGISGAPKIRRAEIEADLLEKIGRLPVFMFPPMPMLFARKIERFAHRNGRRLGFSAQWSKGTDGGTEWYVGLNLISAAIIWYFTGSLGYAAAVIACPIIWDAWLLVLFFFVLDISAFGVLVWVGMQFVF
jgi:hypothetical protein